MVRMSHSCGTVVCHMWNCHFQSSMTTWKTQGRVMGTAVVPSLAPTFNWRRSRLRSAKHWPSRPYFKCVLKYSLWERKTGKISANTHWLLLVTWHAAAAFQKLNYVWGQSHRAWKNRRLWMHMCHDSIAFLLSVPSVHLYWQQFIWRWQKHDMCPSPET